MDRFDVTGSFGWATMIEDSEGLYVLFASHKQALAEKDREISSLQAGYQQELGRHKDDIHKLIVQQAADSAAYQQLMEKAIQFGECLTDDCRCTPEEVNTSSECAFVRAQAFLKSPEVQAWKEQQK